MKVSSMNVDTGKKLFRAAARFRALAPWDLFEDDTIFGVKDPVTGEIGYCCVLGAAGQVFGLCMYRGSAGLDFHQKMQSGEIDPRVDDAFAMQNALLAEFRERDELENEDWAALKSAGFKPKKGGNSPSHPFFRSHLPGLVPWFVTEDEARWLTFALECAADVVENAAKSDDFLAQEKPGHVLTYLPHAGDAPWTRQWLRPEPFAEEEPREISVDDLRVQKIRNSDPKRDNPWEADTFFLPGGTIMDRDRPYFARLVVMVHKPSGYVFDPEMLRPEECPYSALCEVFLRAIEKYGRLPREIHVRSDRVWEALKPVADRLGVRVRMKRVLPAVLELRSDLGQQAQMGFPDCDEIDDDPLETAVLKLP
ncbi:MAG: hypothetical protein HUU37_05725 [Bdellovibrionales bacterium]|nr:hypothetical protein [Bdellovibrionales bacterium]